MPKEINWFYLWGVIVCFVIIGVSYYTYKKISRARQKNNHRRNIYRDGIFDGLKAQANGTLYTLIKGEYGENRSHEAETSSDELTAATHALMIWTGVLAAATILMAYFAYFTLDAIRGQLFVMQTDSAIKRYELQAKLQRQDDTMAIDGGWALTTTLTNVGKTDAYEVATWNKSKVIESEVPDNFDFVTPVDGWSNKFSMTVVPTGHQTLPSQYVTISDARKTIAKQATILVWGYSQYRDIFPENPLHVSYWCMVLIFVEQKNGTVSLTRPGYYKPECNRSS